MPNVDLYLVVDRYIDTYTSCFDSLYRKYFLQDRGIVIVWMYLRNCQALNLPLNYPATPESPNLSLLKYIVCTNFG